jgi:hypothetical protein
MYWKRLPLVQQPLFFFTCFYAFALVSNLSSAIFAMTRDDVGFFSTAAGWGVIATTVLEAGALIWALRPRSGE